MQAYQFVQAIEERQGLKMGAIQEVANKIYYIDNEQLDELAKPLLRNCYGGILTQTRLELKSILLNFKK